MLDRSAHHMDLDAARTTADAAADRAAQRLDVGLKRACGTALALAADLTGADLQVARVNAALVAAGRNDVLPPASVRVRAVLPVGTVDALWLVMQANPREVRHAHR